MAATLRETEGGLATVLSARRDAVATGEMAAALRETEGGLATVLSALFAGGNVVE